MFKKFKHCLYTEVLIYKMQFYEHPLGDCLCLVFFFNNVLF